MPHSSQARLIEQLRAALVLADQLGLNLIACHIDHALALANETACLGQPVALPYTSSVM